MGSLRLHIENKKSNQELRNICLYAIAKPYQYSVALFIVSH